MCYFVNIYIKGRDEKMKTLSSQSKEVVVEMLENQLIHWNKIPTNGGIVQEIAPMQIKLYESLLRNVKNHSLDENAVANLHRICKDLKNEKYTEVLSELETM